MRQTEPAGGALPPAFAQRMQRLLGADFSAFCEALARRQARGLRVNPCRIDPAAFAAAAPFALTPVPWAAEGFFYADTARPGRHPYHEAGVYYIQEPSAMAVGALADAQPGETVLDLCAAPGGKTTHLAGRMGGRGLLVANEIHAGRAAVLAQSVERMGVCNCLVLNETPERLAAHYPGFFDKIIVDAPCSGEGMFRKQGNPAQDEWTPETPALCARRQADILDRAADMLRGGGTLVYSTCTFAPEENEGTLSRFLARHPDFSMVSCPAPCAQFAPARPDWVEDGDPSVAAAFRLWPHRLDGEGHFAAVLRKGGAPQQQPAPRGGADDADGRRLVLEQVRALPDGLVQRRGDRLYLLTDPRMCDTGRLRVRACGVALGTLRKNRLEPAHALAHALPLSAFRRVCDLPADDARVAGYLRGETFPWDGEKGWTAVAADGFVLGWGKCAGGVMKNHYPKGLRWTGR